jgi:hypothetical protein
MISNTSSQYTQTFALGRSRRRWFSTLGTAESVAASSGTEPNASPNKRVTPNDNATFAMLTTNLEPISIWHQR